MWKHPLPSPPPQAGEGVHLPCRNQTRSHDALGMRWSSTVERHPSHVLPHTLEKSLFLARRVTLGRSKIRFIELVVWCSPILDRRPRGRIGLAMLTPGVSFRGRTGVIGIEDAHLAVCRRPALVHRREAASVVRGHSARYDVQADGISRIVFLSASLPRCQGDRQGQNSQSPFAHCKLLQGHTTWMHSALGQS